MSFFSKITKASAAVASAATAAAGSATSYVTGTTSIKDDTESLNTSTYNQTDDNINTTFVDQMNDNTTLQTNSSLKAQQEAKKKADDEFKVSFRELLWQHDFTASYGEQIIGLIERSKVLKQLFAFILPFVLDNTVQQHGNSNLNNFHANLYSLLALYYRHDQYQHAFNLPSLHDLVLGGEHNLHQLVTCFPAIVQKHLLLQYYNHFKQSQWVAKSLAIFLQRMLYFALSANLISVVNKQDVLDTKMNRIQALMNAQQLASKSGCKIELVYSSTHPSVYGSGAISEIMTELIQHKQNKSTQQYQQSSTTTSTQSSKALSPPPSQNASRSWMGTKFTPKQTTSPVSNNNNNPTNANNNDISSAPTLDEIETLPPPQTTGDSTKALNLITQKVPFCIYYNITLNCYVVAISGFDNLQDLCNILLSWPTDYDQHYVHAGVLKLAQSMLPDILIAIAEIIPNYNNPTSATQTQQIPNIFFTGMNIGAAVAAMCTTIIRDHSEANLYKIYDEYYRIEESQIESTINNDKNDISDEQQQQQQQQQQRTFTKPNRQLLPHLGLTDLPILRTYMSTSHLPKIIDLLYDLQPTAIIFSPPSIFSPSLQHITTRYVMSVILQDDIVPKLSEYSINTLLSELIYEGLTRDEDSPSSITNPYNDLTPLYVRQGIIPRQSENDNPKTKKKKAKQPEKHQQLVGSPIQTAENEIMTTLKKRNSTASATTTTSSQNTKENKSTTIATSPLQQKKSIDDNNTNTKHTHKNDNQNDNNSNNNNNNNSDSDSDNDSANNNSEVDVQLLQTRTYINDADHVLQHTVSQNSDKTKKKTKQKHDDQLYQKFHPGSPLVSHTVQEKALTTSGKVIYNTLGVVEAVNDVRSFFTGELLFGKIQSAVSSLSIQEYVTHYIYKALKRMALSAGGGTLEEMYALTKSRYESISMVKSKYDIHRFTGLYLLKNASKLQQQQQQQQQKQKKQRKSNNIKKQTLNDVNESTIDNHIIPNSQPSPSSIPSPSHNTNKNDNNTNTKIQNPYTYDKSLDDENDTAPSYDQIFGTQPSAPTHPPDAVNDNNNNKKDELNNKTTRSSSPSTTTTTTTTNSNNNPLLLNLSKKSPIHLKELLHDLKPIEFKQFFMQNAPHLEKYIPINIYSTLELLSDVIHFDPKEKRWVTPALPHRLDNLLPKPLSLDTTLNAINYIHANPAVLNREDLVHCDPHYGLSAMIRLDDTNNVIAAMYVPGTVFQLKRIPNTIFNTLYTPKILLQQKMNANNEQFVSYSNPVITTQCSEVLYYNSLLALDRRILEHKQIEEKKLMRPDVKQMEIIKQEQAAKKEKENSKSITNNTNNTDTLKSSSINTNSITNNNTDGSTNTSQTNSLVHSIAGYTTEYFDMYSLFGLFGYTRPEKEHRIPDYAALDKILVNDSDDYSHVLPELSPHTWLLSDSHGTFCKQAINFYPIPHTSPQYQSFCITEDRVASPHGSASSNYKGVISTKVASNNEPRYNANDVQYYKGYEKPKSNNNDTALDQPINLIIPLSSCLSSFDDCFRWNLVIGNYNNNNDDAKNQNQNVVTIRNPYLPTDDDDNNNTTTKNTQQHQQRQKQKLGDMTFVERIIDTANDAPCFPRYDNGKVYRQMIQEYNIIVNKHIQPLHESFAPKVFLSPLLHLVNTISDYIGAKNKRALTVNYLTITNWTTALQSKESKKEYEKRDKKNNKNNSTKTSGREHLHDNHNGLHSGDVRTSAKSILKTTFKKDQTKESTYILTQSHPTDISSFSTLYLHDSILHDHNMSAYIYAFEIALGSASLTTSLPTPDVDKRPNPPPVANHANPTTYFEHLNPKHIHVNNATNQMALNSML